MNSKKRNKRPLHSQLAHILVSVFALALFVLPLYATGIWAKGILFGERDPRKVVKVEPMQVRAIDQADKELRPFKEPVVSITFDDGWESVYNNALPLLQKYGIPTTQYIIAGVFDNPQYVSVAQVKSIQQAGHQIGSHTMTHPELTQLTDARLNWELTQSKTVLAKDFGPIKDFASPLGEADDRTLAAIKQTYRSQRNTEGDPKTIATRGVNLGYGFNPYDITGYTVRKTTTIKDLQDMLQFAQTYNGWLVLTYHQVDEKATGDISKYAVTPQALEQQLKLINKAHIKVATVGKVLDAYQKENK